MKRLVLIFAARQHPDRLRRPDMLSGPVQGLQIFEDRRFRPAPPERGQHPRAIASGFEDPWTEMLPPPLDPTENLQDPILEQPRNPGPALGEGVRRPPERRFVVAVGFRRSVRIVLSDRRRQFLQIGLHQVMVLPKPVGRDEFRQDGQTESRSLSLSGAPFRPGSGGLRRDSCSSLNRDPSPSAYAGRRYRSTEDGVTEPAEWKQTESGSSRFGM